MDYQIDKLINQAQRVGISNLSSSLVSECVKRKTDSLTYKEIIKIARKLKKQIK